MSKNLLKLFLFLWAFLLGTINALAQATSGSCGTSITWTYDPLTYTLTLSGSGETASYTVVHQSEMTVGSLIETDPRPYGWVASVCKKIVVGEGITVLKKHAFDGFTALEEIKLPNTLTTIGEGAFRFSAIDKVTLPSGLTTIGWAAFKFAQIGSIVLSAGLEKIEGFAFQNSSITNITLPPNLQRVGYRESNSEIWGTTFAGCDNLETVIVLAQSPFDLVSYSRPNGSDKDALWNNDGSEGRANLKIYVSNTSGVLETYKTKSITTKIIGNETSELSNAVEVSWAQTKIANKITTFDDEGNCGNSSNTGGEASVKYVVAGTENNKIVVIYGNGAMADYDGSNAPWNTYKTQIKKVEFHDGVTRIGSHSFDGCTALEHIDFRPGNITIGAYAFKGCTALTGVELMNGLENIEAGAFQGCTSLGSITIPSTVTNIQNGAFSGSGVTEVVMEGNAPTIGDGVFPNNATINVSPTATGYDTGWSNVKTPVAQDMGTDGKTPGAYYETVTAALTGVETDHTVKLLVDVTENVTFARSGVSVTLDLNDHIINAGGAENSIAIDVTAGTLTITDNMASVPRYWKKNENNYWEDPKTAIDDNHSEEFKTVGGCITNATKGISVSREGTGATLTFNGGNVVGNHGGPGAGIYIGGGGDVISKVTVTEKAVICGNAANLTGGIRMWNGGTLSITNGAKICYNHSSTANDNSSGAGVTYIAGTLKLAGAVTIKNNTLNNTSCNLWINDNKQANITGNLTGSQIGVTFKIRSEVTDGTGEFTTGYASYGGSTAGVTEIPSTGVFFLDGAYDDNYMIVDNKSGEGEIHKHTVSYTAPAADKIQARCDAKLADNTNYCPEYTNTKSYTLTIADHDEVAGYIYDKTAYELTHTESYELPTYDGWTKTISYHKTETENATNGGTELTSAPVNAGYYYAKYSVQKGSETPISAVKAFAIAKKDVTVSGITASDKVYDGTNTATLVLTNPTFTGIVSGDNLAVTAPTTGTFADANVGTEKTVTFSSGITLGGTSVDNYKLAASGQQTSTTANITAKPITVTANSQTVTYNSGGYNLDNTKYTKTGDLVAGHTITVALNAEAAGSEAHQKTITPTVTITDGSSNDVTSNYSITSVSGTLTETVTVTPATDWSTYYWDVADAYLTKVDGLTPYTVTGVTTSAVTTTSQDYIKGQTPYLLNGTASTTYTLTVNYNRSITGTPDGQFIYAATAVVCDTGTPYRYVLNGGEFIWQRGGTIPAGKCYIQPTNPSSTRSFGIDSGDGSTGIDSIENGELNIENNADVWYDMQGRRLSTKPTRKGVYVKNGNKIVIK